MAAPIPKRKRDHTARAPAPRKKTRKQAVYHSDSSDEEEPEQPRNDAEEPQVSSDDAPVSEDSIGGGSDLESEALSSNAPAKRKRNDPDAFATSMSKILGSKLTASKRADPVLSRSKDASAAHTQLADAKLEAKAKHKLKEEKRAALEKGRVKDVLALQDTEESTADVVALERRLRKTAQRGVVKLFNAVRAAQVKGEEAAREARQKGMVGVGKRDDVVSEMSKKGFLDLIAGGGKRGESVET